MVRYGEAGQVEAVMAKFGVLRFVKGLAGSGAAKQDMAGKLR